MINLKKGNTKLTNLTGSAAISSATLDTMRINMSPVTNIHLNTAADPKEVEVHYPGSSQRADAPSGAVSEREASSTASLSLSV